MKIKMLRNWTDLDYTFKKGRIFDIIGPQDNYSCFYKHGMNVIPKEYTEIIEEKNGIKS